MANTKQYPLQIFNTVSVKSGKTIKNTLAQNVKMTKADNSKLFDFSVTDSEGNTDNFISITKSGDESFIRLARPELLTDHSGQPLSANSELKAIFDNGGLKIAKDSGAIEMSHSGDEFVINVTATDGKPYTLKIGSTNVSLSYGGGETLSEYKFSTLSQNACIDVSMPRSTVEEMLANENGLFKDVNSIRSVPGYLMGMYMEGMAENAGEKNCAVKLGKFEICRCEFSDSDTSMPYYFVCQEKAKKTDTLLFTNGSFVQCGKNALVQHKDGDFGFVISNAKTSKAPKYWRIDMQVKDGKTSQAFAKGFEFLQEHTGIAPAAVSATEKSGIIVTASVDGVDYPLVSHEQDERGYTEYKFDYRPKGYTVFTENDSQNGVMFSDEPEADGEAVGIVEPEPYDEAPDENPADAGDAPPPEEEEIEEPSVDDTPPPVEEDELEGEEEPDDLAAAEEARKKREEAALAHAEELEKLEIEEKNAKFKDKLKNFHTVTGETLATVGVFMMICSLIPGVNAIMAVVGLAMSAGGILQSQFAGKLLFDPYRIAKKKVKQAEAEIEDAQQERDLFIERERDLDDLHAQTLEKMAIIDKMMYNDIENGGNPFAIEFAQLFDEFGAGFVKDSDEPGMKQLQNIDMMQSRLALVQQLELIRNAHSLEERAKAVEELEMKFFQDMPEEKRSQLAELFSAENQDDFNKFLGAMHNADSAQQMECDLYDLQRAHIASTTIHSLEYYAQTDKFTEPQRLLFFERYGSAIIRNITVNHNGSTEKLEAVIDAVPVASRQQAESILSDSADVLESKLSQVQARASENLEKHETIEDLDKFHHLVVDVNNAQTATMDDCKAATNKFVKEYTLASVVGERDKFVEDFLVDESVRPSDYTSATEQVLFDEMNKFVQTVSQDENLASQEMIGLQQFLFAKFEQGGLYDQVAEIYAENEKSNISSGGLLADPSKTKIDKSHSAQALALRFAKDELISSIVKESGLDENAAAELRSSLEKQSPSQILQDHFKISKGKVTLKNGDTNIEITDPKALDAATLTAATVLYQKEQAKALKVPNIAKQLQNEKSKEWYVRYDAESDSFVCFDPNAELQDIEQKPEKIIDAAAQREQFAAKSPYFASLSKEQQTMLLQMKLGANMQMMRVKAEYNEAHPLTREDAAAATGAFAVERTDKALVDRVHVYALADKMIGAIIDGKIAGMMDEIAISKVLNAEKDVDYKAQTTVFGQDLKKTLERFSGTQKLFESLSAQEQQDLHSAVMDAVKNNRFPGRNQTEIYSILLQQQQGKKIVDGLTYNDEMMKHTESCELIKSKGFDGLCEAVGLKDDERKRLLDSMMEAPGSGEDRNQQLRNNFKQILIDKGANIEAIDNVMESADMQQHFENAMQNLDDKANRYYAAGKVSKSFENHVKELEKVVDARTDRELSGVRFEYGREFTEKEFRNQQKDKRRDDQNGYEFDDYIEFFESRGLNREFLLSYFSKGKTTKQQDKLIGQLLDKIGLSAEQYEAEKDKIKVQNSNFKKLADSQKDYYKKVQATREYKNNIDKYQQNIAALQTSVFEKQPDESEEEYAERIEQIREGVGKNVCKKLGIDAGAYLDIISSTKLTEAQKHEEIDKLAKEDGISANLGLFKMKDELEKDDYVRLGQTKADCASRAARFERVRFAEQKKQLEGKLGRISEFLENNPDCLFVQDIFNALAKGDKEFFDQHREIDMGEFKISKLDLNLYDEMGVDMDKLVKDIEQNISPEKAREINQNLKMKFDKMSAQTKAKLEKENARKIEAAKEAAMKATKEKEEGGTENMEIKPAVAKAKIHLLANLLQKRKENTAEKEAAQNEAPEQAKQAEQTNEKTNQHDDAERE